MQIVIDISEEEYAAILGNAYVIRKRKKNTLEGAVLNGTLLPKGHGRLIDADRYRKDMQESREFNFFAVLGFQQTIIEADKEEKE